MIKQIKTTFVALMGLRVITFKRQHFVLTKPHTLSKQESKWAGAMRGLWVMGSVGKFTES